MKRIITLSGCCALALTGGVAEAQVLYRETFDSPVVIPSNANPTIANQFGWVGYYNQNAFVVLGDFSTPAHQEAIFAGNSDVDAVPPGPVNSNAMYSSPQPNSQLVMTRKTLYSKWTMTDTGVGTYNGEFKPNFQDVGRMVFDARSSAPDSDGPDDPTVHGDRFHAIIKTGGNFYISQDRVWNTAAETWQRFTIDWRKTKWDQLAPMSHGDLFNTTWKRYDGTTDWLVDDDVDTSGFGVVDSFGIMNWETVGNIAFDNISLLAPTRILGDADEDGDVDDADFTALAAGYAGGLTGWANGDFNEDGVVNRDDFSLFDYAKAAGPIEVSTSVPEPGAALAAAALGALATLRRRVRRAS